MPLTQPARTVELKGHAPISLYLHVPFCARRCTYCDFVTGLGTDQQIARYVDFLIEEIASHAPRELTIRTIFFGGGTPSLLSGEQLGRILDTVRSSFRLEPNAEVSLEANPGTIDLNLDKLKAYRAAGINRISMGVQTFNNPLLQLLGRLHTAEDVGVGVSHIRGAGFDNFNLDLIYGLPGQTLEDWEDTVQCAIALSPTHLSMYALSVEKETALAHQVNTGKVTLPPEDDVVAMYEAADRLAQAAGYQHYEIANWAKPGCEAQHNLTYWHNDEYLGLGIGSHSLFAGRRFANPRKFDEYYANPIWPEAIAPLPEKEIWEETAFLGLRLLTEGLSEARFQARCARSLDELYGPILERLVAEDWVTKRDGVYFLTPHAVPLANEIFERFLLDGGTELSTPDQRRSG